MIHLFREPNLFTENKIENIFLNSKKNIFKKIDDYSNHDLITINIKQETENLIENENLEVPKLFLEKIKNEDFIEKDYLGQNLPAPATYIKNKIYKIEFIIRKVLFSGNSIFFNYSLPTTHKVFHKIEVLSDHIEIAQTNWREGILDNEDGIQKLDKEFKHIFNQIEMNLDELNTFTQLKKSSLKSSINDYFQVKKAKVLKINRNIEKFNEY